MVNDRSDELYENHKHLLCTNREEIKNAEKVMKDAMPLLIHHATNGNSCDKSCQSKNNGKLNMAKHGGDTYIGKMNHKFPNPNMYTDLITMLWNPYCPNKLDKTLNNGKVVRVYTPNLIMVQYRYKNNNESFQRYFYALAAKYKVSEDTAVIVMSSANINDHNHTEQKNYTNLILESANSFETEVDSEPDIRRGELKKMFVNLSGYLIKKEHNYVDITYIRSVRIIIILIDNIFIPNFLYVIIALYQFYNLSRMCCVCTNVHIYNIYIHSQKNEIFYIFILFL
ncbi:hypothetical protein [Plasmodium yoelii yoelii]|uniref:Fam-a protein n=1 Tax=Plasmodium yoelii yoelii TaxID=73239 RepID=Q7RGI1_PLAYO|nr:hypothetical protein [Plasmodium yoelii yoelii]